jgi:hypothetical protein
LGTDLYVHTNLTAGRQAETQKPVKPSTTLDIELQLLPTMKGFVVVVVVVVVVRRARIITESAYRRHVHPSVCLRL